MTLSPTTSHRADVVGLGAVAEHPTPHHPVAHRPVAHCPAPVDMVQRANRSDYQWWLTHVMPAAACSRPVRLRLEAHWHDGNGGGDIDLVTDDLPDGALYVACKNRRASVCPACAETYRADTYQLIKAGLMGGKGVPDTVTGHPCFFVTLTAPAFGPVHTRVIGATGKVRPCRARRTLGVCAHGRLDTCLYRHHGDDDRLGEALCRDCYDYDHQAVWNLHAGELWRRTTITLNRSLRAAAQDRGVHIRLSFAKVAEYQRRGTVHFHALIRLDGYNPADPDSIITPDPSLTAEHLRSHLHDAAGTTGFTTAPHPHNRAGWPITWGDQVDIRAVRLTAGDLDDQGTLTTTAVAAYLAKYATKATEATGHTSRRLDHAAIERHAEQDTHQTRQLLACWTLGTRPLNCRTTTQRETWAQGWGKLHKWAHMLGFGGHFSTKSRRYSTTLTALRAVRKAFRTGQPSPPPANDIPHDADREGDDAIVTLTWLFDGIGWLTLGDAALANTAAAKARERQHTAREEIETAMSNN